MERSNNNPFNELERVEEIDNSILIIVMNGVPNKAPNLLNYNILFTIYLHKRY